MGLGLISWGVWIRLVHIPLTLTRLHIHRLLLCLFCNDMHTFINTTLIYIHTSIHPSTHEMWVLYRPDRQTDKPQRPKKKQDLKTSHLNPTRHKRQPASTVNSHAPRELLEVQPRPRAAAFLGLFLDLVQECPAGERPRGRPGWRAFRGGRDEGVLWLWLWLSLSLSLSLCMRVCVCV